MFFVDEPQDHRIPHLRLPASQEAPCGMTALSMKVSSSLKKKRLGSYENEQDQICADCQTTWSVNMDILLFDNHYISKENNEWNKAALRFAGRYPENGFDEDKNSPVLGDACHISPENNQMNLLQITWASEQKKSR